MLDTGESIDQDYDPAFHTRSLAAAKQNLITKDLTAQLNIENLPVDMQEKMNKLKDIFHVAKLGYESDIVF